MSKHTPKKWFIGENPTEIWAGEGENQTKVANVNFSFKRNGEGQANARLIAAAPELLEACKVIYSDAINHQHKSNNKLFPKRQEAVKKLKQAIAKAEEV